MAEPAGREQAADFAPGVESARRCLAEALSVLIAISEEVGVSQDGAGVQVLRQGIQQVQEAARGSPGDMLRAVRAALDDSAAQASAIADILRGLLEQRQAHSRQRVADCACLQDLLAQMTDPAVWLQLARRDTHASFRVADEVAATSLAHLASVGFPMTRGRARGPRSGWRSFRSRDAAASFVERLCAGMVTDISAALASAARAGDARTSKGLAELEQQTAQAEVLALRLFGTAWPRPAPPPYGPAVPDLRAMMSANLHEIVRMPGDRPGWWTRARTANAVRDDLGAAISGKCYVVGHEELFDAVDAAVRQATALARRYADQRDEQFRTGAAGGFLRSGQACRDAVATMARHARHEAQEQSETAARMLRRTSSASDIVTRVSEQSGVLCAGTPAQVAPLQAWALDRVTELTGADLRPGRELRIVVTAAMKAGKSTLLNALLGMDLLPTRHFAMTCLPTRVELVAPDTLPEPSLIINDSLRYCLSAVTPLLQAAQPDDDAVRRIDRHVHLSQLLSAVRSGAIPVAPEAITGAGPIRAAMRRANDLLRLAVLMRPAGMRPLLDALEPPSVRVPFDGCGSAPVVLIDTPGLDETGAAEELGRLVGRELDRADAAVLVLDFTRLETTTGIQAMRLVKDRPDLFAEFGAIVVNRIDQRRAGDRGMDAVRRFVAHHLGRSDLPVIETSAHSAFVAAAYLGASATGTQDVADELLELCYPAGPPDELTQPTPTRLGELARRQLDRSGIDQVRRIVVDIPAADALRAAARASVRRAIAAMSSYQPADARTGRMAAELIDALTWSLEAAGYPATAERRIAS